MLQLTITVQLPCKYCNWHALAAIWQCCWTTQLTFKTVSTVQPHSAELKKQGHALTGGGGEDLYEVTEGLRKRKRSVWNFTWCWWQTLLHLSAARGRSRQSEASAGSWLQFCPCSPRTFSHRIVEKFKWFDALYLSVYFKNTCICCNRLCFCLIAAFIFQMASNTNPAY